MPTLTLEVKTKVKPLTKRQIEALNKNLAKSCESAIAAAAAAENPIFRSTVWGGTKNDKVSACVIVCIDPVRAAKLHAFAKSIGIED